MLSTMQLSVMYRTVSSSLGRRRLCFLAFCFSWVLPVATSWQQWSTPLELVYTTKWSVLYGTNLLSAGWSMYHVNQMERRWGTSGNFVVPLTPRRNSQERLFLQPWRCLWTCSHILLIVNWCCFLRDSQCFLVVFFNHASSTLMLHWEAFFCWQPLEFGKKALQEGNVMFWPAIPLRFHDIFCLINPLFAIRFVPRNNWPLCLSLAVMACSGYICAVDGAIATALESNFLSSKHSFEFIKGHDVMCVKFYRPTFVPVGSSQFTWASYITTS